MPATAGAGECSSIHPDAGDAQVKQPFHRDGWVYEEKVDGWRILAYKDGATVRLVSRTGVEHSKRFRGIAEAIAVLPDRILLLIGEITIFDEQLRSRFDWLRGTPDEADKAMAARKLGLHCPGGARDRPGRHDARRADGEVPGEAVGQWPGNQWHRMMRSGAGQCWRCSGRRRQWLRLPRGGSIESGCMGSRSFPSGVGGYRRRP